LYTTQPLEICQDRLVKVLHCAHSPPLHARPIVYCLNQMDKACAQENASKAPVFFQSVRCIARPRIQNRRAINKVRPVHARQTLTWSINKRMPGSNIPSLVNFQPRSSRSFLVLAP
jgi:hypothetical protein